jgi:lambda family phage portal protein
MPGYFKNLARALALTGRALANSTYIYPAGTSGYNSAAMGRRTVTIGSSTRGVSSLALSDGPLLTARARKAVMDNPRASSGVTGFIAEVIGTGMRPHSRHSDPDTRQLLEKEFGLWVPQASATRRIGPDGTPDSLQDFYLLQSLICRNVVEAGEAFARFRPRIDSDLSPTGLRVPLQIELIEPEQLPFWKMSGDKMLPGNLIRAGIEFDPVHQRVAYHFYRDHPGDSTIWPNAWEVVRVPSPSVLHIMEFIRGNQIRGITSLAPILIQLADLDDYDDAERLRQKLGAYMFGWKESLTPDDPQLALLTTVGNDQAPAGVAYVEAQPGTMTMLDANAGEKFGFYSHPGVANTYEAFMRIQQQTIATAMRVSYDMLTGDMNQVNYSSARIRLIGLRRIWKQYQHAVIKHQFCRPVWRAWLDAAALAGVIDAKDYRKRPQEYLNVEWLAQPWEYVDPVKDITSFRMEIESCLDSREAKIAERGGVPEEVDAAIKRDHDREKELGIVPVYGNSRVTETVPPGQNEDLAGTEPAPPDSSGAPPSPAPKNGKGKP